MYALFGFSRYTNDYMGQFQFICKKVNLDRIKVWYGLDMRHYGIGLCVGGRWGGGELEGEY